MTTSTAHASSREHYFVPQPSFYPAILSGGIAVTGLGCSFLRNSRVVIGQT